jgi:hypothetical protein
MSPMFSPSELSQTNTHMESGDHEMSVAPLPAVKGLAGGYYYLFQPLISLIG